MSTVGCVPGVVYICKTNHSKSSSYICCPRPQVVIDTGASRPVTPVTPVTPGGSEVGEEGGGNEKEDQPVMNDSEADSLNSFTQLVATAQSTLRKHKWASKSDNIMAEFLKHVITAQAKRDERMIKLRSTRK